MNIATIFAGAAQALTRIPHWLSLHQNTPSNAIDSLRKICYFQQAEIEALQRVVIDLHRAAFGADKPVPLDLQEPLCGIEPDDEIEDSPLEESDVGFTRSKGEDRDQGEDKVKREPHTCSSGSGPVCNMPTNQLSTNQLGLLAQIALDARSLRMEGDENPAVVTLRHSRVSYLRMTDAQRALGLTGAELKSLSVLCRTKSAVEYPVSGKSYLAAAAAQREADRGDQDEQFRPRKLRHGEEA